MDDEFLPSLFLQMRGTVGLTRFFMPSEAFLAWAREAARGRDVYDVGAGAGHVALALAQCGVRVHALDLGRPSPLLMPTIVADGGQYTYPRGAVVMLARPCHGAFVSRVLARARATGASVWYVGFEKNLAEDLGDELGQFHKALDGAGTAGEAVWIREDTVGSVGRNQEPLLDIVCVDWGVGPLWCEARNGRWYQTSGGYCPAFEGAKILDCKRLTRQAWHRLVDETRIAEERAEWDRIEAAVRAQAGDDWLDIVDPTQPEVVLGRVPRAPFVCDALYRTPAKHLMPPWNTVADVGLKLEGDSPWHTDWYAGSGRRLVEGRYPYDGLFEKAAADALYDIQKRVANFDCHVLAPGPAVPFGVVGREIAVLPDLSPKRLDAIVGALAVIAEQGGATAHLAQIGRERGLPVLRIEGACGKFPPGTPLSVFPDEGRVVIAMIDRFEAPENGDDETLSDDEGFDDCCRPDERA